MHRNYLLLCLKKVQILFVHLPRHFYPFYYYYYDHYYYKQMVKNILPILIEVVLGTMNPDVIYREIVSLLRMIGLNELATLTPDRARDRGIPWVPGVP